MAGNHEQVIKAPFRGEEFGVVDSTPPTINQYHSTGGLVVRDMSDLRDPKTERLDRQEDEDRSNSFPGKDEHLETEAYREIVYKAQIASGKTEAEAKEIADKAAELKFGSYI